MAEENLGPAAGMDKKAAKKAEKARRKEEKRNRKLAKKEAKKNGTADEFEEESGGGKAAVVFVTLMIIVIWIAILAVLIHFDVGGFGSTVMQPILKDVPYVNKILPKTEEEETKTKEDSKYPYKTVDEAVAYIKELEKELADAKESNSENDAYVADLEAQAAQWKEYKDNEQKFEEEKAKFSDAILPFIILTFMIIGLAGIIYLHITEIRKISGATAVEIEYDGKQQFVTWKAPDGRTYSYNASYAPEKSNSVTLYYKGTDYRNGIIKTDVASWIKFYAAFTVIIGGLIFWIYKIFHKKKHVISK